MFVTPDELDIMMGGIPLLAGRLMTILLCVIVLEERYKMKLI